MKKLLILTSLVIVLLGCSKRRCYTCDKEQSTGRVSTIEKCFNSKDKRRYVKSEIDKYENSGYKCKAQLID